MAHLKNFGVGNFRAFKDLYKFDFAPITVLTGTNSSGKSSLTKAILLNKQSYSQKEGVPDLDEIRFDANLKLGNYDTVLNNNDKEGNLIFEVPCRFTARCLSTIRLYYTAGKKQIKNGSLCKLEIYNNDDKNVFLTYNQDGDEAGIKVKFDILYEMALFDSSLKSEYISAISDLIDLMSNLGIDNIDEENLVSYPEKVIELYNTQKRLSFYFAIRDPIVNNLGYTPIYGLSYTTLSKQLPLFEYHAITAIIYPDLSKKLYELYEHKHFGTYEEYQANCKVNFASMALDAQNAKKDLADFLVEKELEILNNLLFKVLVDPECGYIVGKDLTYCMSSFLRFLQGRNSKHISDIQADGVGWWYISHDIYERQGDKYVELSFKDNVGDPLENLVKEKLGYEIVDRNKVWYSRNELWNKNDVQHIFSNSSSFFVNYIAENLEHAFEILDRIYKGIDFIPSVRGDIDRRYRMGDEQSELKKLLNSFFKVVSSKVKSLPFIDKWITAFGIADKVEFLIADDSYDSRIVLHKNGKTFDLADVGYGYSQLVPIILKIALQIVTKRSFYSDISSSILIIEEPETNLHPALQSKLADMFVECYKKYEIQFIIETHSEYLIRRLQRRTAEFYNVKKKSELSIPTDFTQIYYFYPPDDVPEGEKQIYPINIEKDGGLTKNFGTGFFDEAGNEDLLLYQIAKHNRN